VGALEAERPGGEAVPVGRLHERMAVAAEADVHVVRGDEDHVELRRLRFLARERKCEQEKQGERFHHPISTKRRSPQRHKDTKKRRREIRQKTSATKPRKVRHGGLLSNPAPSGPRPLCGRLRRLWALSVFVSLWRSYRT